MRAREIDRTTRSSPRPAGGRARPHRPSARQDGRRPSARQDGRRPSTRQDGFSLIEVMIALTILAIGLLSAAQLIPLALVHTRQGQVRTNAVEVAQRRVDALRSSDFSSAALAAGTYTATEGSYGLVWTITDSVPVPRSKRIVLTSSWNTSTGVKGATLTTYVTPGR